MLSGDGLVVRVRPRGGRLSSAQAAGIAELSARHGNGLIDLTGRANLQIRGVSETEPRGLDRGARPARAGRRGPAVRNASATSWSRRSGATATIHRSLARELERRSGGAAARPARKIRLCHRLRSASRVLAHASADIRIERGVDGGLIVRADGGIAGAPGHAASCDRYRDRARRMVRRFRRRQEWARAHGRASRRRREAAA